jgi:hypothetical protein
MFRRAALVALVLATGAAAQAADDRTALARARQL